MTIASVESHVLLAPNYDPRHTEVVAAVREALGPDVTLKIDVQYLWGDAATCLSVVKDWAATKGARGRGSPAGRWRDPVADQAGARVPAEPGCAAALHRRLTRWSKVLSSQA
jgi:hypothetical protein